MNQSIIQLISQGESETVEFKSTFGKEVIESLCAFANNIGGAVLVGIKIFDQSISFFNPGKLFGDLTVDQLRGDDYQSRTRNKLVSEAFYLSRDIEKYGSGFIRIREEIRKFPAMDFTFSESGDGFLVTLEYSQQNVPWPPRSNQKLNEGINEGINEGLNEGINEGLNEGLNEGENKLFDTIKKNPGIRIPEMVLNSSFTKKNSGKVDFETKKNESYRVPGK